MVVIFLQASFYALQDFSAAKTMNSILSMLASDATVIRDGVKKVIPAENLLTGDLVLLTLGDKVPGNEIVQLVQCNTNTDVADLRLIEVSSDVKFDR